MGVFKAQARATDMKTCTPRSYHGHKRAATQKFDVMGMEQVC